MAELTVSTDKKFLGGIINNDRETSVLPSDFRDAIEIVGDLGRRKGLETLVVGSTSVALLGGDVVPQDLDVLVLGSESQKDELREDLDDLISRRKLDLPKIDFSNLVYDGEGLVFSSTGAELRCGKIKVPVPDELFEPVVVIIGNAHIPVLHPQVALALLRISNHESPKIVERISQLEGLLGSRSKYLSFTDEELSCFQDYKERVDRFRASLMRALILKLRKKLHKMEEVGSRSPLVRLKAFLRDKYPTLTEEVRKFLS